MANVFKLKTKADILTSAETLYTAQANKTAVVLGLVLANKGTATVKATVTLESNTSDTETNENVTLLHEVSLPVNSTLEFFSGQKLILQATDVMKVKSDTASSLDVTLSIMEQDV
tara:strand:+ start:213 stop:557 length:345 start_codon:yes stop_codon:yes gene_type:complete